MPLRLNVGASKKIADGNYGSRGASVNVELELDGGLIGDPAKLQEKIRQLFGLVRTSLHEELNGGTHSHDGNDKESADRNGGDNGGQRNGSPRPATQSQTRALHAIAKDRKINLTQTLRDRYQVGKPEELTIKQASELIDNLKNGGR